MIYYTMIVGISFMDIPTFGMNVTRKCRFLKNNLKNACIIQTKALSLQYQVKQTHKHKIMETMINTLAAQAAELMKNQHVVAMLNNCTTEEEKQMKLAIAAMYAIAKANA